MKVKISPRTNSYAVYVERGDEDELVERLVCMAALGRVKWIQEVYDGRYKKIIVLRHVVP